VRARHSTTDGILRCEYRGCRNAGILRRSALGLSVCPSVIFLQFGDGGRWSLSTCRCAFSSRARLQRELFAVGPTKGTANLAVLRDANLRPTCQSFEPKVSARNVSIR
jgi:hypothetical protein